MLRILNSQNKNIKTQYCFSDCKNINALRFDAFDVDNNIAYEYQGQQHYHPVNFGGISDQEAAKEYNNNQKRDNIKRKYCINNNITLITIPYWEYDNMENYIIERQREVA